MHAAGTHQIGQLSRQRGEAETPTYNQSPCVDQGRKLLGPAALRTCPLASLLSQVRAYLGPGGYCRRSGNGGPQSCLPAACAMAQSVAQYGSSSPTKHSRPWRGAKPRGADDTRSPQEWPRQVGSRGGGEIKARGTSKGSHDASHDDQEQAGSRRAPARAVSSFPLWCKGGKRRRGVPRHQAKVSLSVQRDQDQQYGRTEITAEPKTASSPVPLADEYQL